MSIWRQLSSEHGSAELTARLHGLYREFSSRENNNFFPIEVRHYLADYIETRPWKSYQCSEQEYPMLTTEFQDFITALKNKSDELRTTHKFENIMMSDKLMDCATSMVEVYGQDIMNFIKVLKSLLNKEMALLAPTEDKSGVSSMMNELNSNSMLISLSHQINTSINIIGDGLKQVEGLGDSSTIARQDAHRILTALQWQPNQFNEQQKIEANRNVENYKEALQRLDGQIRDIRMKMSLQLNTVVQLLDNGIGYMIQDIDQWRGHQRLCLITGEKLPPLDEIQGNAQRLCENLSQCGQYLTRIYRHVQDTTPNEIEYKNQLTGWQGAVEKLIEKLITRAFIIEEQPPQVMKKDTKFSAKLRLLVGDKFGLNIRPPEVRASLINSEQARLILSSDDSTVTNDNCGELCNNQKIMEYSTTSKTLHLTFKNMTLKKYSRADRRGTELVTEEKFALLFRAKVHAQFRDNSPFLDLHAMSLPTTVIVHGNQQPAAEATIFWDNSFSSLNRDSFQQTDTVKWEDLKVNLNHWFSKMTQRGLSKTALDYLGCKLLRVNPCIQQDLDKKTVRWQHFAKEPLPDRAFNFWEWLYGTVDLIKKSALPIWKAGLIEGFISRQHTESILRETQPSTFLLRFSDSMIGGLSVSWLDTEMQVAHVEPWTHNDLRFVNLQNRILDPQNLRYLYPNIPKESKFRIFVKEDQASIPGYQPGRVHQIIPNGPQSNMGSPLSNPPESYHDDTDMILMDFSTFEHNAFGPRQN